MGFFDSQQNLFHFKENMRQQKNVSCSPAALMVFWHDILFTTA